MLAYRLFLSAHRQPQLRVAVDSHIGCARIYRRLRVTVLLSHARDLTTAAHTHVCVCVCVCVCVYVCMYVCMCVCVCVCIYTYTYTYITYISIYICRYIYIHIHTQIYSSVLRARGHRAWRRLKRCSYSSLLPATNILPYYLLLIFFFSTCWRSWDASVTATP